MLQSIDCRCASDKALLMYIIIYWLCGLVVKRLIPPEAKTAVTPRGQLFCFFFFVLFSNHIRLKDSADFLFGFIYMAPNHKNIHLQSDYSPMTRRLVIGFQGF